MEASKVILTILYALMFIVIAFSMALCLITNSINLMIPVLSGVFVLAASATGFYYWKAKAENIEKIRKDREERGSGHVEMQDIMSIKDDTAAVMAGSFGGTSIDTSSNVDYTDSDIQEDDAESDTAAFTRQDEDESGLDEEGSEVQ